MNEYLKTTQIFNARMTVGFIIVLNAVFFSSCGPSGPQKKASFNFYDYDSARINKAIADYRRGKYIFNNYCISCHYSPEKHVLDQNMFDQVFDHLPPPPEKYFVDFISDSKALKKKGDEYAINLDKMYSYDYEHNFRDSLSRQDMNGLIFYMKVAATQRADKPGY